MGPESSTGVAMAARRSPSAIWSFISSAMSFSLTVKNSTSAEITMSTEAMRKGISMVQIFRASSAALM